MLCAVKRSREGPEDSPMQHAEPTSCSPHRAMMLESPASKRTRSLNMEPAATPSAQISPFCGAAPGGAHRMPLQPRRPPCTAAAPPLRWAAERGTHPALRDTSCAPCRCAGAGACDAALSATLRQRVDPHTGEVLFSLEQVKDIVRKAVDEKERCLREQYDRILQEKLQEQFRSFSKFNEDYISRSLKSGDLSYCS